jgi:hypothetical protein
MHICLIKVKENTKTMTEVWQIQVLFGTISIFPKVDKIFGKVQFIFLMHVPDPGHYPAM